MKKNIKLRRAIFTMIAALSFIALMAFDPDYTFMEHLTYFGIVGAIFYLSTKQLGKLESIKEE